jgi:phage tail sheath gpL-like
MIKIEIYYNFVQYDPSYKMHICNEHSHKQTKKWLKQVFQVHTNSEIAAAAAATTTTAATTAAAAAAVAVVVSAENDPSEPLQTTTATDPHQSPSSDITSVDSEISGNNDGQ